jgi:hypothetical protein
VHTSVPFRTSVALNDSDADHLLEEVKFKMYMGYSEFGTLPFKF